jgi:hypothetical protein
MITAIVALTALTLTVLAFVLKHAILHFVCVVLWIIFGVTAINNVWPEGNTYMPIGFGLMALVMAIVNLVIALNLYLGQRTVPPTHDQIQAAHRKKVLELTTKRGSDPWW